MLALLLGLNDVERHTRGLGPVGPQYDLKVPPPPLMIQQQTNNNLNSNVLSEKCTYEVSKGESRPFLSWWWCATIIGAIPTIIINSLLSKVKAGTKRVDHESVDSCFDERYAYQNANYEVVSNKPFFVTHNSPTQVNRSKFSIKSDIKDHRPQDYMEHRILISDHSYVEDLLNDYSTQVTAGVICQQDDLDKRNRKVYEELVTMCTCHERKFNLHLPTILTATRELFGLLEESRKHFKATTNRRLSVQEINYYFGKHMMPKVVSHLSNNPDYEVDGLNIYATAQEVIYLFLRSSGRALPHRHLMTDECLSDIEVIVDKVVLPWMYTDYSGETWELRGTFVKTHTLALGRCLFQFPTAELISDAYTQ